MLEITQTLAAKGQLTAGFGEGDITPSWPTRLSYGADNLISEKYDTCYVKAMLVEVEDAKVLWLSYDLIGVRKEEADEIKVAVAKATGIDTECMVVAATHGHSYARNRIDTGVQKLLIEQSLAATKQAIADLSPAKIGVSQVTTPELWTINRANVDGVVDRDLYVIRIDDLEGKMRGIVFDYPAHPVHHTVFGNKLNGKFGPDWPGFVRRYLEAQNNLANLLEEYDFMLFAKGQAVRKTRADIFTMFLHGTAGDVKANSQQLPNADFDKLVAEQVWKMALETETTADVKLKFTAGFSTLDGLDHPVPLQAMWINDTLWLTFPAEIVAELGLLFKQHSQGVHNILVTTANDYIGYVVSEATVLEGITYESKGNKYPQTGNRLVEDALLLAYPEKEPVRTSGYSGGLVNLPGRVINYEGNAKLVVTVFTIPRKGIDFIGGFWGKRVPVQDDGTFEVPELIEGRKFLLLSELEPGAPVIPPQLKSATYKDNIIAGPVEVRVEPGAEAVIDCVKDKKN